MKPYYFIIVVILLISSTFCCTGNASSGNNIKDLEENMMDIRVYHENLGGDIKKGDIYGAQWLLKGMDSILLVVSAKFTEHRKLDKPFRQYYEKDMKEPISKLSSALEKNDIPAARSAYTLLTRKCNGCHDELDIYKEVQNWLK